MSNTGELKLEFNQLMNFGRQLPNRNDVNIIMKTTFGDYNGQYYVYEDDEPTKRRLQDADSKFTWTVKGMTQQTLEFDIQFTAPLDVSNAEEPDTFEIEFLSDKFVSLTSEKPLNVGDSEVSLMDF